MRLQHRPNGERFIDRRDAGRRLAETLSHAGYAPPSDAVVLALPRGGVPVGFEVARRLDAPLDVFLVRKLGVPGHEELAMGAIASGGVIVLNRSVINYTHIQRDEIDRVAREEGEELQRRERAYRGALPPPDIEGKTVILTDDGLATGASMRAAAQAVRNLKPAKLVVAVPVAAPETCAQFRDEVDEVVCALTPDPFSAVGMWYEDFSQTTDDEVRALLASARAAHEQHVAGR